MSAPRQGAIWRRLARIGVRPDDDDRVAVQKQMVTLAAAIVASLSTVWVAAYVVLGLPLAAAIPLAYQVLTAVGLVAFARTGHYEAFARSQLALMVSLPFVLQLTLGGFENGSAVGLWAVVATFGAVYLLGPRRAQPWFLAFLGLLAIAGLQDAAAAAAAPPINPVVRVFFFVLNVGAVTGTAYVLLRHFVTQRDAAEAAAERLLFNVLPSPIARRLRRGEATIAEAHDDVTVLFADVVDFTPFVARSSPDRLLALLDRLFTAFDGLVERHGVEKVKTVGDAYMVVGGAPEPLADHTRAIADLALAMLAEATVCRAEGLPVRIRIGIDRGPVIAGVIGRSRLVYDLWGDPVNTASRMESAGLPDRIQVTAAVVDALADRYLFEPRDAIEVKGKGVMRTWFLVGRRSGDAGPPVGPVQSGASGASSASSGRTSTA